MNTSTRHWQRHAALLALALAASRAPAADGCLSIEVQNVRPQQGQLMLAAYGSAESFNKKAMANLKAPAAGATTRLQMCGISGDTIAITLFQDLDSDGQLGRNLLGFPNEPWGASGTPGRTGPSWDNSKVKLEGGVLVIKLST